VRIWLLGGFQVSVGPFWSIRQDGWHLRKAGHLIKLLALAPEHSLHREQATNLLWPKLDARAAANNLHHALHVARRTLEPSAPDGAASSYLHLRDERLALCPDGQLWVDVDAFEEAATIARHALDPTAYRAAIDLYSGELLPQDRYEPWADQRRAELRGLYLALLVELAGLNEERREYEPAIEALSTVVAAEPTHEGAHVGLMRLYALSGRRREALGQYERLREALLREFGSEPEAATRYLQQEIWADAFPPAPSPPSAGTPTGEPPSPLGVTGHNLPIARTSFVGRERETHEVRRLLAMTGLLTLTGAGGCGKTRLAMEVARELASTYSDGVWMVELAPLSDPGLAPQAVALALGVREMPGSPLQNTLTAHLRTKRLLLVVDNCEHLVDSVAHLAEVLLSSCPKLRILATSREPLGVRGETVWTVPTLSLPEEISSVEELMSAGAVRLFLDRTRSRLPDFELKTGNAGSVGRICRKLEGIPLAIELAAARMGALAAEQVAGRLEDSLKLLTGGRTLEPRQQTLRATLDWSHDLLDEPERRLFRRLSVFAGGWTLEAAEEVSLGEGITRDEVMDLLSRLVDKSLVLAEASPGTEAELRYRLLEPIRQYGQERLQESREAERVRERHAEYYLALAKDVDTEEAEPPYSSEGLSAAWLERMDTEQGNLRVALYWSLGEDAESGGPRAQLGLRLAVAMYWFWQTHDYLTEGRRWLEMAVSRGRSNPTATRLRARALNGAAWIALHQADYGASKALMEESLALHRELGDKDDIAAGLTDLGKVAVLGQRDDIPLAAVLDELRELKPGLRTRNSLASLLILEGLVALGRGELERSAKLHEESLKLSRKTRDTQQMILCLGNLGTTALLRADYEGAGPPLRESLRLGWETDYKVTIQFSLNGLAYVAAGLEQPVRAARLWGAVESMQEVYGVHVTAIAHTITDHEARQAAARSQLGEEAWSGAWADGKAMPLERAIEYALSEEVDDPTAPAAVPDKQPPAQERLTRREREVARSVGRGLTNRQIAQELSLSESTVENHVHKILKKLGFSSRARIAAWVAQQL
jgi:predicted ATPase/DNA-binding SARP family transcriptional activator/DNA-binding CsgD family transcriptional regulator